MQLQNQVTIGISGRLKLTATDLTGKVLHVDEGPNMIVNTGIEDICHLVAGDTVVPADLIAGQPLYHTQQALPRIPLYGQFGRSGTTPASTDASPYPNGTLDANASSPTSASDILKTSAFFPVTVTPGQVTTGTPAPGPTTPNVPTSGSSGTTIIGGSTIVPTGTIISPPDVLPSNPTYVNNQVVVQFSLLPGQGNGPGGTDVTYREVVLMSKIVDNPIQYRWFARRVFGDIIKNPTTLILAEWTFSFIIVRDSNT